MLSLLYGLKNLDFFDLGASATSSDVWPFLLAFVVLLPVFVLIERRAADPVLNLSYFRDRDIDAGWWIRWNNGIETRGRCLQRRAPALAGGALRLGGLAVLCGRDRVGGAKPPIFFTNGQLLFRDCFFAA